MQRNTGSWAPKLWVIMEESCIVKSHSLNHNPFVCVYDCEKKLGGTICPMFRKQSYQYFPQHINEVDTCNHGYIEVVDGDEG